MLKHFINFFITLLVCNVGAFAQDNVLKKEKVTIPNNWYQLDLIKTGYYGVSLENAYSLLKSKKLKSNRIIVAVIDTGIDTLHEDIKPVLWTNQKEISGNGIDDDHNGYIDDIHGWNFLGNKDGRNVKEESYEAGRIYYTLKSKWDEISIDTNKLTENERLEYQIFNKAKVWLFGEIDTEEIAAIKSTLPKMIAGDSIIKLDLGKAEYNANDLKDYTTSYLFARITRSILLEIANDNKDFSITNKDLLEGLKAKVRKADAATTPPRPFRKEIIGDDETNINDRNYGNNDIMADFSFHGTHCSGIIAAARNNNKGIDGIADNVQIMMLRAVPDGDEYDKDIANAIYYAVDNGAKIINMSFGKDFSLHKQWVDDAFRYADSKGVLLVHAAGNDSKNIDIADNFPNPVYLNKKERATNVITVGASGNINDDGLAANFSNYGKSEVDVFAPGVNIYSTIPGKNTYGKASGTSMSSPVVAGIAALILGYYPKLSPQQLKYIIERTATVPDEMVNIPGTENKVNLNEISKTGGIVNAYEAVKLAGIMNNEKEKTVLPKPKMKKIKMG